MIGKTNAQQNVSAKEDKTNKVTTISAQSTDTQYPSAKCTYDAIDALKFDVLSVNAVPTDGLESNTKYNFGVLTSQLTITLKTPTDTDHVNEYAFEFTTDADNAYFVNLPMYMPNGTTAIKWQNLPEPTASTTYQVSIENGCGLICSFTEEGGE